MRTSQPAQFQFGFMLAAVHQILAVDRDRKIAIMPIQHHLAAVRRPGCSYFFVWFHFVTLITVERSRNDRRNTQAGFLQLAASQPPESSSLCQ
jgi:hypothetical protein